MSNHVYFLAFRYAHLDQVVDGNTVIELDAPIRSETTVRSLEAEIAETRGVDPAALGLVNIVQLDTPNVAVPARLVEGD